MKKKTYLTPEMVLVEMDLRNDICTTSGGSGQIAPPGEDGGEDDKAARRRTNAIWD